MGYDFWLDYLAVMSWYLFFNNVIIRGEIIELYSFIFDEVC